LLVLVSSGDTTTAGAQRKCQNNREHPERKGVLRCSTPGLLLPPRERLWQC
jgi:hypothetical protein